MDDLFWLTDAQVERLKPFFPLSHGVPRVDDRRVLSGYIHQSQWLALEGCACRLWPPKTLYNRRERWSRLGVFARILTEQAAEGQDVTTVMIDATHLKAHRTASSLRGKEGEANGSSDGPRVG